MLSAGLVISVVWVGMAVLAWSTIRRYADLAGSFASASLKQLPNPFAETICNRARKRMHFLVLLMIAVFMFMYLELAVMRLASS